MWGSKGRTVGFESPLSKTDYQNKRRNFEHYCRKIMGMDCMTYYETKKKMT
jgi:hypothetical protein